MYIGMLVQKPEACSCISRGLLLHPRVSYRLFLENNQRPVDTGIVSSLSVLKILISFAGKNVNAALLFKGRVEFRQLAFKIAPACETIVRRGHANTYTPLNGRFPLHQSRNIQYALLFVCTICHWDCRHHEDLPLPLRAWLLPRE